jgi:hypothetical protein
MSTTYLSCAETAKLVRAALKKAFPGVKFSVKSHTYSGGASIDVGWTDGPTQKAVEEVTNAYAGGGFDGMIDMAYSKSSWLMPDGSAAFASCQGTTNSMGTVSPYSHEAPAPGALKVRFGANHVFANRSYTTETYTAAVKAVCDRYGMAMPEVVNNGSPYIKGNDKLPGSDMYLDMAVHRELAEPTQTEEEIVRVHEVPQ